MKTRAIRILSCLVLVLAASAASAYAVELRYAHVGSEGDIQHTYVEVAAKALDKATEGRVKFRIFPASQLGGVSEMVDGIKMGSIAIGHHEFSSLDPISKDAAAFNVPYVYRDGEHALRATDPKTSPVLQKLNEAMIKNGGVRIIGRVYRGTRNISCNFAVRSPADLTGKPFRCIPTPLGVSMVKGFTAIPTPVEVAELPTALMTGLVVGQENPLTMINANKIYEVQTHISMTGHQHAVLPVFINEAVWRKIPAKDQEIMMKVLDETAWESLKWAKESDETLVRELTAKKITFIFPKDGLDIPAFAKSVGAQMEKDFPAYKPIVAAIQAIQ
jgi:TRAP-type C4-dicarboxylate transport system substrate-binding protein